MDVFSLAFYEKQTDTVVWWLFIPKDDRKDNPLKMLNTLYKVRFKSEPLFPYFFCTLTSKTQLHN